MAIKLKEGAVKRGTAAAGYADADIPFEPAGPDAQESIVAQFTLHNKLLSKTVVVTLEKPYLGDPNKTVVLVYGRDEATPVGPDRYREPGGTPPVLASDRLESQDQAFQTPRWEPGKWKHYHLRFKEGVLGQCDCGMPEDTPVGPSCFMPAPVAKLWFGDYDVPLYEMRVREGQVVDQIWTRTWHRERVANEMWGGYEWDFPVGSPGVNRLELRRFVAPPVPHVVIQRVDSMMRRLPNTDVRPWDLFRWQDQLHKGERQYHNGNRPGGKALLTVTEDEFNSRIAAAVAAALAAQAAAPGKKNGA